MMWIYLKIKNIKIKEVECYDRVFIVLEVIMGFMLLKEYLWKYIYFEILIICWFIIILIVIIIFLRIKYIKIKVLLKMLNFV